MALFQIGPVRVSHSERAKIKIKVQLSLHGIFTIDSASVSGSVLFQWVYEARTLDDALTNLLETLSHLQLIKDRSDDSTVNNSHRLVSENVEPSNEDNFGKADDIAVSPVRQNYCGNTWWMICSLNWECFHFLSTGNGTGYNHWYHSITRKNWK